MSRERREIFSEINITPLTDIFLVLLIIMMVIAPMLDSRGLKLAVPTIGPAEKSAGDPKAIELEVMADGKYLMNHQPISAESIQEKLFQSKSQYPDGLIIETQPDALHGAVVKVMDAAKSAGIEKIAVSQVNG